MISSCPQPLTLAGRAQPTSITGLHLCHHYIQLAHITVTSSMERGLSATDEMSVRHELEQTLHTALFPGTEVMTDGTFTLTREQLELSC